MNIAGLVGMQAACDGTDTILALLTSCHLAPLLLTENAFTRDLYYYVVHWHYKRIR